MAISQTWREPGKHAFSVVLGGDFCPREENCPYVAEHAAEIVDGVKGVFKEDAVKILQWECAVTDGGEPIVKCGPNLRCSEKVLDIMSALDIDIALLANNHTGDYGPSEIFTTVDHIRNRGIQTVGAGKDAADAAKPLFIEKNGVRLAILNICETEFGGALKNAAGVNTLDPFVNIEQIKAAKEQADVVLVTLHGGHEHNPYPSERMVRLFRAFAEAGADAVWNCHTHCPEGFEVWNGVPIIYSPGNFYFPARPTTIPVWRFGYITEFLFDENGVYGYQLVPYGFTKEKMFLLEDKTLEDAENYLIELCKPLNDADELRSLFDSWCTGAGVAYMGMINNTSSTPYPPDWDDPEVKAKWIGIRNALVCESHVYLLRNLCFLIEQGRFNEARKGYDRIEKMRSPEFITW